MGDAVISPDERYRYTLERDLQPELTELGKGREINHRFFGPEDTCLFVMLNPSTADADQDDPTIRRCKGFATDWGFGRLTVANLYALRSSDPTDLQYASDPVGVENDRWIDTLAATASLIIVAWGSSPYKEQERVDQVLAILEEHGGANCIGTTAKGDPRHPLYVPKDAAVEPYREREPA